MNRHKTDRITRIRELIQTAKQHPPRSEYRARLMREVQDLMNKQPKSEIRAERRKVAA